MKNLKEFAQYVSANVISMIGLSIYVLADTFFISVGMGANGLAALNFSIPVYNLINGCGLMFGIGGAAYYIVSRTRGEREKSNRIFTTTMIGWFIVSVVFLLCGIFLAGILARLLGANADTFEMTRSYMRVILLFGPFFVFNQIIAAFSKSDERPRLVMFGMLAGSLFNIIFDYIFIFPMGMGMLGAALATGFAPLASCLVMSLHFIKKRNTFALAKPEFSPHHMKRVLAAGAPSFVMEFAAGIVMIIFNLLILRLEGNDGVAAYGIFANLNFIMIAIFNGIAQGAQPLLGRNYATGNHKGLRFVLRASLITAGFFSVLCYALSVLIPDKLTAIFNSEGNTHMARLAIDGFPLFFLNVLFMGANVVLIMYFVSIQRDRISRIMSYLKGFIVVTPATFILATLFGIRGIWLAMPIAEFATFLVGVISYLKKPA